MSKVCCFPRSTNKTFCMFGARFHFFGACDNQLFSSRERASARTCIIHLLLYIYMYTVVIPFPIGHIRKTRFPSKSYSNRWPWRIVYLRSREYERIIRRNHLLQSSDKKKKIHTRARIHTHRHTHTSTLVLYTYSLSQKVLNIHIRPDTHTRARTHILYTYRYACACNSVKGR